MEDSRQVKVLNRTSGMVSYTIPEMQNLRRLYQSKEEKIVSFEELRRLMYIPGGETILREHLIIEDKEAIEALGMQVEPEYFYTEEDILRLFEKGSLDQFLDCLDFAPKGVLDMIKSLAVETELNDIAKRQAILDKTGFDVTKAIELEIIPKKQQTNKGNGRRAAVPFKDGQDQDTGSSHGRRVQISK